MVVRTSLREETLLMVEECLPTRTTNLGFDLDLFLFRLPLRKNQEQF
jgi:hypothetical protein